MNYIKVSFLAGIIMISNSLIAQDSLQFNKTSEYDKITDKEGNIYRTVVIGNKIWMAENLKVTKYRNGEPIAITPNYNTDISNEKEPKYVWAYNGRDSLVNNYGRLYTWYVVQDGRGICPDGFRVPTDVDWVSLINSEEGDVVAGGKLKEVGLKHWIKPNQGATNETGFTALPGGYRENDGKYYVHGFRGYWWSSKNNYVYMAWNTSLVYSNAIIEKNERIKKNGLSVRCVKN